MENPIIENHKETLAQKTKAFYKQIGHIWCPTLGDYVAFSTPGFRHLLRGGAGWRSRLDKRRRFLLLKFAPQIIASPHAKVVPGEQTEKAKFWEISEKYDKKLITVVVRQIGQGNKHFFSTYND
jgi:hypothetical protein